MLRASMCPVPAQPGGTWVRKAWRSNVPIPSALQRIFHPFDVPCKQHQASGDPWGGTLSPLVSGQDLRVKERREQGQACRGLCGGKESSATVRWSVGKALSAMPLAETLRIYLYASKPSRWLLGNSQLHITWYGNGTELRTNISRKLFCCEKPPLLYYSYFSASSESTAKKRLGEVRQLYGFSFLMQIICRTSNDQDSSRVINIALDFDGATWWLIFSLFLK